MLSPKQAAQLNPSCPALCRQDTTSPWSTVPVCETVQNLILTPALKMFERNTGNRKNKLSSEQMTMTKHEKKEEMNKNEKK